MNVPEGIVEAARALFAEASRSNVRQVHEVVIRDVDARQDKPRVLHLIPLGDVIGVAITADGEYPKDADLLFVAAAALGSALPALGFTVRTPVAYLVPPESAVSGPSR